MSKKSSPSPPVTATIASIIPAKSTATFSPCQRYRYTLGRVWEESLPTVMFVCLNPSTATLTKDDPTVRRCIGFARLWGFGSLTVMNIFAYRSTDPKKLLKVRDPVGPDNDHWIREMARAAQQVVIAWGGHGTLGARDQAVLELLSNPHCLGTTKAGAPKHPLYLAASTPRQRFESICAAVGTQVG